MVPHCRLKIVISMLWRAMKTRGEVVGNSGQGICRQGRMKAHRPDKTYRHMAHAEGCPMPVQQEGHC